MHKQRLIEFINLKLLNCLQLFQFQKLILNTLTDFPSIFPNPVVFLNILNPLSPKLF